MRPQLRSVLSPVLAAAFIAASAQRPALARPPLIGEGDPKDLYRHIGRAEAARHGVPFALIDAVMSVESSYNAKARGGVGEIGLMQVRPATAAMLGFTGTIARLAEPAINIAYGVRYLAQAWRLARGDVCTTVMKYRAGHGETRFSPRSVNYCKRVQVHLGRAAVARGGVVPVAAVPTPKGPPAPIGALPHLAAAAPLPAKSTTVALPGPPVELAALSAEVAPAAKPRSSRKARCFRRVVQPGRRFGACIPRSVLAKKGLLRNG